MIQQILLYFGAGLPFVWGVSHLIPTKSVVSGFGDITPDNQHIITMEWIVEGLSLIFIGTLVAVITWIDPFSKISVAVYILTAVFLVLFALVSFATGFRVHFFMFKLCPVIFGTSACCLLVGALL